MRTLLIAGTVAPLGGVGNLFPIAAVGNDGATKKASPSVLHVIAWTTNYRSADSCNEHAPADQYEDL
jgi:hypothetical protein